MNRSRNTTLFVWGVFDLLYISWYSIESLVRGNIPYVTDISSIWRLLPDHGVAAYIFACGQWLLQISLIVSAVLLLKRSTRFMWLYYFQIPLRLVYYIPSISIVLIFIGFFGSLGIFVSLILLTVSEIVKVYTLRKFVS